GFSGAGSSGVRSPDLVRRPGPGAPAGARRRARLLAPAVALAALAAAVAAAPGAAPVPGTPLRPLAGLDTTSGRAVYEANCAGCHGFAGEGLRGAVPPLAGNVPVLLAREGGREYLVGVLLTGLSGEIEVLGERYDGVMPSWAHLGEAQVADVLNHVATAWGNAALLPADAVEFTDLEVGLARAFPVDQAALARMRRTLARPSEQ